MDLYILEVIARVSILILTGLIGAALLFAMIGLKEVRSGCQEGVLYLAMAVFFGAAHFYLLTQTNLPASGTGSTSGFDFWRWAVTLLAPALLVLYFAFGLLDLFTRRLIEAKLKIFFGLTLVCYLYLLGRDWAGDLRGIIALIWCGIWFNLQLRTTPSISGRSILPAGSSSFAPRGSLRRRPQSEAVRQP
ncbi:MAG TPA: hypothetical protein VN285_05535 [Candidatus Deferrimicrobium sp.]|nr:hypothetical protein [Candidatus Deferrimicrobium sp.]